MMNVECPMSKAEVRHFDIRHSTFGLPDCLSHGFPGSYPAASIVHDHRLTQTVCDSLRDLTRDEIAAAPDSTGDNANGFIRIILA